MSAKHPASQSAQACDREFQVVTPLRGKILIAGLRYSRMVGNKRQFGANLMSRFLHL